MFFSRVNKDRSTHRTGFLVVFPPSLHTGIMQDLMARRAALAVEWLIVRYARWRNGLIADGAFIDRTLFCVIATNVIFLRMYLERMGVLDLGCGSGGSSVSPGTENCTYFVA